MAVEGDRDWWSQIEDALRSKALANTWRARKPGGAPRDPARPAGRQNRLGRQRFGLDLNAVPRWFGHIYNLDILEQRALLMSVLAGPSKQHRVPMMAPEPTADFVQRPHEFGALKAKLLNPQGDAVAITAALRGAGGYGKTTLARALAHDADIIDAYFDGILWVEFGRNQAICLPSSRISSRP